MNIFDDYNEDPEDPEEAQGVTCKRCGVGNLEWIDTGVRNRLIDAKGHFHVCSNDNAIDDFEVIE